MSRHTENSAHVVNIPYYNLYVSLLQETSFGIKLFSLWKNSAGVS